MKIAELTIDDLAALVRDFQADCFDGFVSNDKSYIELWLEKRDMYKHKCTFAEVRFGVITKHRYREFVQHVIFKL